MKRFITNNMKVCSAHTRLCNALDSAEYLLYEREGQLSEHQVFDVKRIIYELKNAKSWLEKTTFNHKDKYTRRMKK